LIGSRLIRQQGGCVLAQDQATSTVWGMPGAVAGAGLADKIVALDGMAAEIVKLAGRGSTSSAGSSAPTNLLTKQAV